MYIQVGRWFEVQAKQENYPNRFIHNYILHFMQADFTSLTYKLTFQFKIIIQDDLTQYRTQLKLIIR